MSTEIEVLESHIRRHREELERHEAQLEKLMNDSAPPRNFCDVKTRADLRDWFLRGYFVCNYQPGRVTLMAPRGGGSAGYIYGDSAEELGREHDAWNVEVFEKRRAEST